jgi:hypothetical protein
VDDYFRPVGGMMRREPLPSSVTEGTFVVSMTPHLQVVGDSITRCLMQRVRSWMAVFADVRPVILAAVRSSGRSYTSQMETEAANWRNLLEARRHLQLLCCTGDDFRSRDACICLVQVYAEFHPRPDLGWLGVPESIVEQSRGLLQHNITRQRDLETVDRIAAALGEVRHLNREMAPDESKIDAAIASGGLVIVESERRVYWQREPVEADWRKHKKPWELLWKLAVNARMGAEVDHTDLYESARVSESTMRNRWSRLRAMIPGTLARHVEPGENTATYRLVLPIARIFLFSAGERIIQAARRAAATKTRKS